MLRARAQGSSNSAELEQLRLAEVARHDRRRHAARAELPSQLVEDRLEEGVLGAQEQKHQVGEFRSNNTLDIL